MDKKKILILDNSKSYLKIIASSISSDSISVETERRADMALMKIINWCPDLLITGVEVGNINGFDLCLILKMMPDFAGMPIVLMSSHDNDDASRRAAAAGADIYVQKDRKLIGNLKRSIETLLVHPEQGVKRDVDKRSITRVLVVDDSNVMRMIIKNILSSIGITSVVEAENGKQGLERLGENEIDMVISDWNMPVMNGSEFVGNVRKNPAFKDLCIVMVTAEGPKQIEEAMKAGANDYLHKPFNAQAMKNLIARFAANIRPFAA